MMENVPEQVTKIRMGGIVMYVNLNTNISPPSVKYRDGNPSMEAEPVTARKITEDRKSVV